MKAILIIDMPEHCKGCLCYDIETAECYAVTNWNEDENTRPAWCPLIPMNFRKMGYKGYVFYNRQWLKDHLNMESMIIKGEAHDI